MNPNPLLIPLYFQEIRGDRAVLYCTKQVAGKNIRFMEYYNKEGLLERVNVWGICGERLEYMRWSKSGIEDDCYVARDRELDSETMKVIRGSFEELYPKPVKSDNSEPVKLTFFNTVFN